MTSLKQLLLLSKIDERIHSFIKYNSPIKLLNLLLLESQRMTRSTYLYAYPIRLAVEPTNICNLKCPECSTGLGEKGRQKGFRSLDTFCHIIDDIGKYAYLIDIFKDGEPFLNEDIFNMIEIAEKNNICACVHSNFNIKFDEETAERLIESQLSYLTLSLDGSDQEVYSIYRRGGNFKKVIENAKILIQTKKRLNKKKPYLIWQFLIFSHNQHQLEEARQLANKIGFDAFKAHKGILRSEISKYIQNKKDDIPRRKDIMKPSCDWLWTNATFHWDDRVAPCCLQFNKNDDFGSIHNVQFKTIWNNKKFLYARSIFARNKKSIDYDGVVICNRCFKYP